MLTKKCVVLFSGNGSNLENLLNKKALLESKLEYIAAFTNNVKAGGIDICKKFNVNLSVSSTDNINLDLNGFLSRHNPDLIILAGYMKILPTNIVKEYHGKIINIHPSLLPKYPGLNTHKKVLENDDTEHGATIHFVTDKLDEGPIILQGIFKIKNKTTIQELETFTHNVEYEIYPIVVKWFAEDYIKMKNDKVFFQGKPVQVPIIYLMKF